MAKYGEVGYSLGQRQSSYRAGVVDFSFYKLANANGNLVSVGGELHDLTFSQDDWLITEGENSLDSAIFGRDYRDYYRRSGWRVYVGHNFGGNLSATVSYGWEGCAALANGV